MPNIIAISAESSVPNPASISGASRTAQGWASGAGRSSAAMPSRTSASLCATTASASSSSHCSRPHASSWLQGGWPKNCENRLLAISKKGAVTMADRQTRLGEQETSVEDAIAALTERFDKFAKQFGDNSRSAGQFVSDTVDDSRNQVH